MKILFTCFVLYVFFSLPTRRRKVGDGPNTVSESTVSNTKLSEFFVLTEWQTQ